MISEPPSQEERTESPPVQHAVLKTKFSVPRGPLTMVSRDRLLDALDAGVQGPLTLLTATKDPSISAAAVLCSLLNDSPRQP